MLKTLMETARNFSLSLYLVLGIFMVAGIFFNWAITVLIILFVTSAFFGYVWLTIQEDLNNGKFQQIKSFFMKKEKKVKHEEIIDVTIQDRINMVATCYKKS